MSDTTDEKPQDPDAPIKKTLPSGKVVEIRSHRTLLGSDIAAALASQPGGAWMVNSVAMRNHFMATLVTEIEPGRSKAPTLDGSVAAVEAQRGDDYRALYSSVDEAMALALGLSVIPDIDGYEDPKAPTTATSDSRPDSEADAQP